MAKRHGVTDFLRVFEDVGTTFFDIETDMLIVLDDKGNIERVNPAFERITGYNESAVLGRGIIRFVCMDDWASFLRTFTAIYPESFRLLRGDGGYIRARLVAVRFRAGRGFLVLRKLA